MLKALLGLMLIAALALAGCGKKSEERRIEKAIENNSGGQAHVDLSKNQMTLETKKGEKMQVVSGSEGLKVPDDFPKDIYVYTGAKVEASIKTPDGTQLTLATADPAAKVADEYKAQMKKAGWEEKISAGMSGATMLEYAKDGRDLMVHITGEAGNTKILLMMSVEEK